VTRPLSIDATPVTKVIEAIITARFALDVTFLVVVLEGALTRPFSSAVWESLARYAASGSVTFVAREVTRVSSMAVSDIAGRR